MNPEKLRRMQEQVRTGGKGSVRRKRKAAIKTTVRRPLCVPAPPSALLRCGRKKKTIFFFASKKNDFSPSHAFFFSLGAALSTALTRVALSGHG